MASPYKAEILGLYGLRPTQLSDKPLFDQAYATIEEPISDYTFANTFMWGEALGLYWDVIEGHLCLFANSAGDLTMLLPPIGEGNLSQCLKRCFAIMDDFNDRHAHRSHSRIEYVSDRILPRLIDEGLASAPMGGDYIYDMSRMIELPGGGLKSKRQAKNRFLREHAVRTEPLAAHHIPMCKELLYAWQVQGDAKEQSAWSDHAARLRTHDTMATGYALEAFETLKLKGMVLWADDRLAGFTLGERLSDTQASILIEKTDRNLDGSAQYIFSEFCRQYWSSFPECNVGDDWGLPSLRWTKESYHPIRLLGKHVMTAVPTPLVGWTPEVELPIQNPPSYLAADASAHVTLGELDWAPSIGPATPDDLAALISLEQRAFAPGEAFTPKQLRYLLRSRRTLIKVARVEGTAIGWAIALLRHHKRHDSARIYSLAVDPAYRGRGLGRLLACSLLDEIEAMGISRCFLEVRDENLQAQQLYEGLGFTYVARLPHYYGEGEHGRKMLRVGRRTPELVASAALARPVGLV